MPRKIVVHSGFHMTGTSAVQAVLRANRKTLMPALALRLKGQMKDVTRAAHNYTTHATDDALHHVSRSFDTLLSGLPEMSRRTLLLSADDLAGAMPGVGSLATYSAVPVLMYLFWQRAQVAFPDAPVAFCFTTCSAERWQRAIWAEHVITSRITEDYGAFCAAYPQAPDLARIVQDVTRRVPAPVHSFALEKWEASPLGLADAILDLCTMPDVLRSKLMPQPTQNIEIDDNTLAALLHINRTQADAATRKAAKAALLGKGPHP